MQLNGETVTLVNRTKEPLPVTFDGKQYWIPPGETAGVPKVLVKFAKEQNRLMGSEDYTNPARFESKIGVKGTRDPITPLDVEKAEKGAVDRFDRPNMKKRGQRGGSAVIIAGDPVSEFEARVASDDEGGEGHIDGLAVGAPPTAGTDA